MKRILNVNLIIAIVITINSCSKNQLIGKWDDNIKLSTRKVEFNASADSVTITTGDTAWWIDGVSVNDKYYHDTIRTDPAAVPYLFKKDCFVLDRQDKNTLFIKVEENTLNVPRVISVELQAGDYFDRVTITQKSK
jgi:hypothetical protein